MTKRSASVAIQTPGAPAATDSTDAVNATGVDALGGDDSDTPQDEAAALRARVAELEAANKALQADVDDKAKKLIVYEPETPHAAAKLAASETAGMTVAQVVAAIDAGKLAEPHNNYLCADGYYSRRQ